MARLASQTPPPLLGNVSQGSATPGEGRQGQRCQLKGSFWGRFPSQMNAELDCNDAWQYGRIHNVYPTDVTGRGFCEAPAVSLANSAGRRFDSWPWSIVTGGSGSNKKPHRLARTLSAFPPDGTAPFTRCSGHSP